MEFEGSNFQGFKYPGLEEGGGGKWNFRSTHKIRLSTYSSLRFSKKHQQRLSPILMRLYILSTPYIGFALARSDGMCETILRKPRGATLDQYYSRSFSSCKVTKNWKKLKEDGKIITEIISLAFFQNENFSNIVAKWYQQFNVRYKSKQISISHLLRTTL